jgi:hypothetical protein
VHFVGLYYMVILKCTVQNEHKKIITVIGHSLLRNLTQLIHTFSDLICILVYKMHTFLQGKKSTHFTEN